MTIVSKCQWQTDKMAGVWVGKFLILELRTTSLSTGPGLIKLLKESSIPPDLELSKHFSRVISLHM